MAILKFILDVLKIFSGSCFVLVSLFLPLFLTFFIRFTFVFSTFIIAVFTFRFFVDFLRVVVRFGLGLEDIGASNGCVACCFMNLMKLAAVLSVSSEIGSALLSPARKNKMVGYPSILRRSCSFLVPCIFAITMELMFFKASPSLLYSVSRDCQ